MRFPLSALLLLPLILTGCAMDLSTPATPAPTNSASIHGVVHGGQQPLAGAHVYLFIAGTTGYGLASTNILNASSTGYSDALGAYVPTGNDGSFNITGDYTCPYGGEAYLLTTGGNPSYPTGSINSAASVMAVVGFCPAGGWDFSTSVPYIIVNEASTVAAAYAISGFATDSTHVSYKFSGQGIIAATNAFANAGNLESLPNGVALATTPASTQYLTGTVPQATINTLADILASCINSTGPSSSACTTLFANATSDGTPTGTQPTDTASAAINIAHHPTANVASLFNLVGSSPPFVPTLSAAPSDYTIAINFSSTTGGFNDPTGIAVDSAGSVWVCNAGGFYNKYNSLGRAISGSTFDQSDDLGIAIDASGAYYNYDDNQYQAGDAWIVDANAVSPFHWDGQPYANSPFTGGGLSGPFAIAINPPVGNNYNAYPYGYAWVTNFNGNSLTFVPGGGSSTAPGYTGGGLNGPIAIAIDGSNNAWVANWYGNSVSEFDVNFHPLTSSSGYTGGGLSQPRAIAIDASGNVWVANYNGHSVTKLNSSGTPDPNSPFVGGGLAFGPIALAVDGSSNIWVANQAGGITELSNSGAVLSGPNGFASGNISNPYSIAADQSGDIWVANTGNNSMTEFIGISTPVVTPIAVGVLFNTLGTRP